MNALAPRSLALARSRRAALPAAVHALERALDAPMTEPAWSDRLAARVEQLDRAFFDHVQATEGPDGTYATVLATDPRLAYAVDRLLAEHRDVQAGIERLAFLARSGRPDPVALHQQGHDLLERLARHRRHDADLLHEAYEHDIGGYG